MNMLNNASDYLSGNINKDKAKELATASSEVTIEDGWEGSIKAEAFAGYQNLVSINTNGITGIEDGAFKDCIRLKTLIIPRFFLRIGENVFENCHSLCKVDAESELMAETIIEKVIDCGLKQRIDIYIAGKFMISIKNNCEYLVNDKVPELMTRDGCVTVWHRSFTGMTKNIISAGAFKDINDLRGLDISEATAIEGNPFENCTNLNSVNVRDENMAETVIKYLIESGLKQEIDIRIRARGYKISIKNNQACLSNLSRYGRFDEIVKDNNFILPHYDFTGDLEYVISSKSLLYESDLQRLDTNAIVIIEDKAFEGCKNLEEIYLPNVKEIGKEVFKGCKKLRRVHVRDDMVDRIKEVLIESGLSQQIYIYVNGTVVDYLYNNLSKARIEEAVARNESWVAYYTIEIPKCYIKIEDNTFEDRKSLQEVFLSNVKEIGNKAFEGCIHLCNVHVSDDMVSKIKEILIKSGLYQQVYIYVNDEIVDYLYNSLSYNIIAEDVVRKESWILSDDIEIPEIYTKIDAGVLDRSNLTKINTNKVTTIGNRVFTSCDKLEELYMPNVIEIGENFCKDCPKLRKITVKDKPMANLIKDILSEYQESRLADINIYIDGENAPFLKMKVNPLISKSKSIAIVNKICSDLNIDQEIVKGFISMIEENSMDNKMSFIVKMINNITNAAGKSLPESEIESMIDKIMPEIDN